VCCAVAPDFETINLSSPPVPINLDTPRGIWPAFPVPLGPGPPPHPRCCFATVLGSGPVAFLSLAVTALDLG
jgi:hypothetical protein